MLWGDLSADYVMSSSSWIFGGDATTNSFTFEGVASLSGYLDFGPLATPSTDLAAGRVFQYEDDSSLWYYNGSDWLDLTATGTGSTYSAAEPLSLVGTEFDIDYAS